MEPTQSDVLYGYRATEVELPTIAPVAGDCKMNFNSLYRNQDHVADHKPMRVSLGCHVDGAANPVPDLNCPITSALGVGKRFISATPQPDPALLLEFSRFVGQEIELEFTPLKPDTDLSVMSWLYGNGDDIPPCNYTDWRKKDLMEKFNKIDDPYDLAHYIVKSFIKDESYPEFKHSRAINSRTDEFKCLVGPCFRAIEKVVFQNEDFIKKVPMRDRSEVIHNDLYLPGAHYGANDFSSYEASMVKPLMEACEFQLYEYMLRHNPEFRQFMHYVRKVLAGTNICEFKWFTVYVEAKRMSGEMNTSLGNGFTNRMVLKFLCKKKGCTDFKCKVEGDDSVYRAIGDYPDAADFAKLGLVAKLEVGHDLNEMSFCGLIYDEEDKNNVTDPIVALLDFGWTTRDYAGSNMKRRLELLRSKSLSMAYAYPGCPILSALARYGLRVTRGVRMGRYLNSAKISQWDRDQLIEAIEFFREQKKHGHVTEKPVGFRTRLLVERKFNLPVNFQLSVESYLDGLNDLKPLVIPNLDLFTSEHQQRFYAKYHGVEKRPSLQPTEVVIGNTVLNQLSKTSLNFVNSVDQLVLLDFIDCIHTGNNFDAKKSSDSHNRPPMGARTV